MDMQEQIPKNPIEAAEPPPKSDGGNIHQWKQELGGEASLTRIERGGRQFIVVAAEHFSEQAARFFQEDIKREITNPEEWYFLVEGKDSGIHECEIAKRIAEEKKIPIEDPFFHPFQAEVIELYLASDKAKKNFSRDFNWTTSCYFSECKRNFEFRRSSCGFRCSFFARTVF
jgi:hypothetical protein